MFVAETLGACSTAEAGLAGLDIASCADDDLLEATVQVARLRSLSETVEARLLAELDARGTTDRVHGMRTASWAATETGCARGPVAGRLRVGRALRDHFGAVDAALSDGTLRFDHAKALSDVTNPRITDALAGAQDEIVALAEGSTFAQWKRDVAALAERADADGPEPDPCGRNELRLPKTLDGRTEIAGSLDAASGLIVRTAIDAKADELFRRYSRDHDSTQDLEIPSRAALYAEALVELVRIAVSAESGSGLAPRAEVTLLLHGDEVTDADGVPMPRAATDVWGCDPDLWAVIVDHMGIPVDVGHTRRLATMAQRRAIAVRDGGCTFPGCDAPIDWCDHHHVADWRHGGATDMANLVALCRHHHGVTHRNGWTMTMDDDQIPHWITPSGDQLTGQRRRRRTDRAASGPPPRGGPGEPGERHGPRKPDPTRRRRRGPDDPFRPEAA